MICFLLVHNLDDVINMTFKKSKNNKNCIIFVLNYIMPKINIIKMIKVKFKIILNDKIYIELYYYALFINSLLILIFSFHG